MLFGSGSAAVGEGLTRPSQAGRPAVTLQGTVGGASWRMVIAKGLGRRVHGTPCVSVGLRPARSRVEAVNTVCGSVGPDPLVVGNSVGEGSARRSVVGMAFPVEIEKVRVWLRGRGDRILPLSPLSKAKAATTGVVPLRYAALAFAGNTCLSRVIGFDAHGRAHGPRLAMNCSAELR